MILKFMISTSVILILFVLGGQVLSPKYTLVSSIEINAPLQKVKNFVFNLNHWKKWSPFKQTDKTLVIEKESSLGATQTWKTPNTQRRLVFTQVDKGLRYDVFLQKDELFQQGTFTLKQEDENVLLTWSLSGEVDSMIVAGYVAFVIEHFSGSSLYEGLKNIKRLSEEGL